MLLCAWGTLAGLKYALIAAEEIAMLRAPLSHLTNLTHLKVKVKASARC
jgi:hypothetical protein